MTVWSWRAALVSAAVIVGLAFFWANLAPKPMGGDSTYLVTSGISMEPNFHTGDLVVLRPSSAYRVGEIVGYRTPLLGIVLHRIIGERGGHFYMKGDNNHFVDPYHPTPSDVVGRLWLHLPKVGSLVSSPRKRELAAVAASAATAGTVLLPSAGRRRKRRKQKGLPGGARSRNRTAGGTPSHRPKRGGAVMGVMGLPGQVAASVIALLALGGLALGAVAFTRPSSVLSTRQVVYTQTGTWAYSAKATGDVYQDGVARTGDPIFSVVAPVVSVSFRYELATPVPARVKGSARLVMVVASPDGWSRTFPLTRALPFAGLTSSLSGKVDLRSVQDLLARIQRETGQTTTTGSYTLALQAQVDERGTLAGAGALEARFDPVLSFTLGSGQMQAVYGQPGTPSTLAQLVHPSARGSLAVPQETAGVLRLFSLDPTVALARTIAVWMLVAALMALGVITLLLRKASRAGEAAQIQARYGALLVAAERPPSPASREVLRLGDIRDLVRVAERTGHVIVQCAGEGGRDYFVCEDATTYMYSARSSPGGGSDRPSPVVSASGAGSPPLVSSPAAPAAGAGPERVNGATSVPGGQREPH